MEFEKLFLQVRDQTNKVHDLWFKFMEQLIITGALLYFSVISNNGVVWFIFYVSLFLWSFQLAFFSFELTPVKSSSRFSGLLFWCLMFINFCFAMCLSLFLVNLVISLSEK